MAPLPTLDARAALTACAAAMRRSLGSTRVWDLEFLNFVDRLDDELTADELVAGVAFARAYGAPVDRWSDMEWGESVRDEVGDARSVFRRIATHPAADTSVWIALLRARDPDADAALLIAQRPYHDSAFRRAALRFRRLPEQCLLRLAMHAYGGEFERVARFVARRAAWMERAYGAHASRHLLHDFERVCAVQVEYGDNRVWRALLDVARANGRRRGMRPASPG